MNYHLAQINIARMLAPLDSELMADFVSNLDSINRLAEESEGFVWRLIEDPDVITGIEVFQDSFIVVNMSVWTSTKALFDFTYRSEHRNIFKRRKEWFSTMKEMHMACWYIPQDTYPTPHEAGIRLEYLNRFGESPFAFSLKNSFTSQQASEYKVQTWKQQ
jgi:hypothetical protein